MELGMDLQKVSRIERIISEHGDHFLERIYTRDEQHFCDNVNPKLRLQRYTSLWAVKEAVMKALGEEGLRGIYYADIETVHQPDGKPSVQLYNNAAEKAEKLGLKFSTVTMTHLDDYAIAVVLFEQFQA